MKLKTKLNQSGFSHVVIFLLAIVVIGVVGFVGWKVSKTSDKTNEQQTNIQKPDTASNSTEPDISLQNLGIANMDSVLINKEAVREYAGKGLKGFYPFGDKLGGKEDTRLNPNFEFSSLKADTELISPIDGIVAFIKQQSESGDYEVFIQPKNNSAWTIGFDHVTNVKVKKDAKIKAGEVVGEPSTQGNGAHRFEIQINKDVNGTTTHHCPSTLLDGSVKVKILADLSGMQNSWEASTGLDLYDLAKQDPIGCIKKTMSVSEAEGS